MPQSKEDLTLLEAWRGGDADAGDELLRRHFAAVFRFFEGNLRPSGSGAGAEDLTQRTFEACIAGRDRVHTDFRAYLFRIARRELMHEWDRRRARGTFVTPSQADIKAIRTSPSAAVARLDEQRLFLAAMAQLPLEFKAALELFYWEDRPIAAIAEELGIALGTVKSRLFRGKALLKEHLRKLATHPSLMDSAMARLEARTAEIEAEDES